MNRSAPMVREVADKIYRIDVNHPQPLVTCCYLAVGDGIAAVIDCGGGRRGAAAVMAALQTLAISPQQVAWMLVTHAHLDHAGAAGLLMQQLPRATFAAHPSAHKHLLAPEQALIPASRRLFGNKFFDTYYGGMAAVPAERARPLQDGEELTLGADTLTIHYTPGHAWHHLSFYHPARAFVFAGDAYGVSYRALDADEQQILVPVMPPSQFNPPAMIDSIRRLHALNADYIGLAHYDVLDAAHHGERYAHTLLDTLEDWMQYAAELFAADAAQFNARMKAYLLDWIARQATEYGMSSDRARQLHSGDIALCAGGLEYYLRKQAAA